MDDQDQSRFVANLEWFSHFFGSIRQLYGIIVETLPTEFSPEGFTLKSGNFYFPRQNSAPTMPPHYALMIGGRQFALQTLTVFDPALFGKPSPFDAEPSIVVVLHSRPDRYGYITDYALRVIGNRGIEIIDQTDGKLRGEILDAKPPAEFFSFQVSFDKFSPDQDSNDAVRQHIVDPIVKYLNDG